MVEFISTLDQGRDELCHYQLRSALLKRLDRYSRLIVRSRQVERARQTTQIMTVVMITVD